MLRPSATTIDSQFKASSNICIVWLFSLGRNLPSTRPDNIAPLNLLQTRVVSNKGKEERKIQMCHVTSYNTERLGGKKTQTHSGSKIPVYQLVLLGWEHLGNSKFSDIARTPLEQWDSGAPAVGSVRGWHNPAHPTPGVLSQTGWEKDRFQLLPLYCEQTMLLPHPGKSDCYYMGWLQSGVRQRVTNSCVPVLGQRDTLSVDVTAAVSQHELVHAAKRFCTNICILLILLYPKTWLLFFPNASQYCLILI